MSKTTRETLDELAEQAFKVYLTMKIRNKLMAKNWREDSSDEFIVSLVKDTSVEVLNTATKILKELNDDISKEKTKERLKTNNKKNKAKVQ